MRARSLTFFCAAFVEVLQRIADNYYCSSKVAKTYSGVSRRFAETTNLHKSCAGEYTIMAREIS